MTRVATDIPCIAATFQPHKPASNEDKAMSVYGSSNVVKKEEIRVLSKFNFAKQTTKLTNKTFQIYFG